MCCFVFLSLLTWPRVLLSFQLRHFFCQKLFYLPSSLAHFDQLCLGRLNLLNVYGPLLNLSCFVDRTVKSNAQVALKCNSTLIDDFDDLRESVWNAAPIGPSRIPTFLCRSPRAFSKSLICGRWSIDVPLRSCFEAFEQLFCEREEVLDGDFAVIEALSSSFGVLPMASANRAKAPGKRSPICPLSSSACTLPFDST